MNYFKSGTKVVVTIGAADLTGGIEKLNRDLEVTLKICLSANPETVSITIADQSAVAPAVLACFAVFLRVLNKNGTHVVLHCSDFIHRTLTQTGSAGKTRIVTAVGENHAA